MDVLMTSLAKWLDTCSLSCGLTTNTPPAKTGPGLKFVFLKKC
jgi:hypothetical protein